jgi:drug/metabolite transporter (DMT)-like permease
VSSAGKHMRRPGSHEIAEPRERLPDRLPRAVPWVMAVAMAVIGFAPILVRWAGDAPALAVVTWRTLFAIALLAPVAFAVAGHEIRRLSGRDWALAGGAGIFLGLHFTAWTASIYHTSVASASVLVTTSPLFIALLGWLVLRETLRPRTLIAIAVGVAGAALIGVGDATDAAFPRAAFGNTLALSAAVFVAIYLLIGRVVRQRTALLAYLVPVYAGAAATTLAIALYEGTPLMQPWPILGLSLLLALGPQLIVHGTFNYAVRFLPAAVIGLASLAEPVVGTGLALLFFGEVPSTVAFGGMALVLSAIAVTYARVGRRVK